MTSYPGARINDALVLRDGVTQSLWPPRYQLLLLCSTKCKIPLFPDQDSVATGAKFPSIMPYLCISIGKMLLRRIKGDTISHPHSCHRVEKRGRGPQFCFSALREKKWFKGTSFQRMPRPLLQPPRFSNWTQSIGTDPEVN